MKTRAHNGAMHRITPTQAWPLHDIAATRALEAPAQPTLDPHVLMQRAGLAQEVAHSIVWLLSAEASYTTGAILDVSGGR